MGRNIKTAGAIYGGAVLEKVVDVGVKTTDATPITPVLRNSTIYNIIAAIVGAVPVLTGRGSSTVQEVGDAFSAAAVNNLIEDAAKAARLPGAGVPGAVSELRPPGAFTPFPVTFTMPSQPPIYGSATAGAFGAPALF